MCEVSAASLNDGQWSHNMFQLWAQELNLGC
jgi:hypothetical protein